MHVVTVDFRIAPDCFDQFLPLMLENATRSLLDEPGCTQFDVCHDPARNDGVFLYEVYENQAAFDAHLKTPHYLDFASKTAGMILGREVRALQLADAGTVSKFRIAR